MFKFKKQMQIQTQVQIERLLLLPKLKDISKKETQAEILSLLNWLNKHYTSIEDGHRTVDQLHLYLSKTFQQRGFDMIAGLLYMQTGSAVKGGGGNHSEYYGSIVFWDKYGTLEDIDSVVQFLDLPNKTPFEEKDKGQNR